MYDKDSKSQPPAEPHYSRKRWTSFIIGNVVALVLGIGIFLLFLYGDFMSDASEGLMTSLFKAPVVVVVIASLPLIITIAIGVVHMRKAIRKRRAERQALMDAARIANEKPTS